MSKSLMVKLNELKDLVSSDLTNFCAWGEFFKNARKRDKITDESEIVADLLYEDDHFARYIVRIPPNTESNIHWHNCSERCKVLSGEMYDTIKERRLRVNEEIIYSRGERHRQYNPSLTDWCVMLVDFHR